MDSRESAGLAAVPDQRHEAGVGVRLANADGAQIYVTTLTGFGLGHLLYYGRERNVMDQVIGIMVVIVPIRPLAEKLLFAPWARFLHRRLVTGIRAA